MTHEQRHPAGTNSDTASAATVSADPKPDHTLAELFEERAAIRQYDGKLSRADAECLAARDVVTMAPEADPSSVDVSNSAEGGGQ